MQIPTVVMRSGVVLALLLAAGTVEAQSLAELSRQIRAERARRADPDSPLPERLPDLTKNVLTDADLYVYTTEPRPVRYERFVVHTPAPVRRRDSSEPPRSSIREWNETLDELRTRSMGGAPWGLFAYSPVGYGLGGLPRGKARSRDAGPGIRGSERRSDRSSRRGAIAPLPKPAPYVPPETVMSPRIQGCWAASGAWANGRCVP